MNIFPRLFRWNGPLDRPPECTFFLAVRREKNVPFWLFSRILNWDISRFFLFSLSAVVSSRWPGAKALYICVWLSLSLSLCVSFQSLPSLCHLHRIGSLFGATEVATGSPASWPDRPSLGYRMVLVGVRPRRSVRCLCFKMTRNVNDREALGLDRGRWVALLPLKRLDVGQTCERRWFRPSPTNGIRSSVCRWFSTPPFKRRPCYSNDYRTAV